MRILVSLLGVVFRLISTLVPNRNLMVIGSSDGFSGNARAFYEAVVASPEFDGAEVRWVLTNLSVKQSFDSFGVKCVPLYTVRGLWLVLQAKWLVSTHGEMARLKALFGQIYVNLWHGPTLKTGGYLWNQAEGDRSLAVLGKTDWMPVSSRFMQAMMSSIYHIKAHRLVVTGYPRNDWLVDVAGSEEKLRGMPGNGSYDKIILYCPTHRQVMLKFGEAVRESQWSFKDFHAKYLTQELSDFLVKHNTLLLVRLHPFDERRKHAEEVSLLENLRLLTNTDLSKSKLDMYEILGGFDAVWTDYSSIYFDFMLTEKPAFFFCDDLSEYNANRGLIVENYSALTPGPKIDTPEKLRVSLEQWLNEPDWYVSERVAFNKLLNVAQPPYSQGLISNLPNR